MQLLIIYVLIQLVQDDPGVLAAGIFAFTYTLTLLNRFFEINTITRQVEESLLKASSMSEMLKEEIEIQDSPDAKKLVVSAGEIKLDNVTFAYENQDHQSGVFKHLSLTIQPGEKVGVVGPSGGGKSTLTRLLMRFEDVNSGAILIDGQNIAEVTQGSLRSSIAYVSQEPLLFHRTIRENIAYGDIKSSKETIISAAKKANAHDFIMSLPNGYETVVGERGIKLSGGQRQRVAIARAILKNAPLLILDEATSALDSESEVLIQAALTKLMKGRTSIVIAHRLSTIQRMDRIIVIDNGKIVQEGSHKSLLDQQGIYSKLWAHQSGGFLED
jgi:ATP-binding cassette subfamily B protein